MITSKDLSHTQYYITAFFTVNAKGAPCERPWGEQCKEEGGIENGGRGLVHCVTNTLTAWLYWSHMTFLEPFDPVVKMLLQVKDSSFHTY